jgi:hypothetical protein
MTTAKLAKSVRDPRSGESHLPSEEVTIISRMRNLASHIAEGEVAGWAWCSRKTFVKFARAIDVIEYCGSGVTSTRSEV